MRAGNSNGWRPGILVEFGRMRMSGWSDEEVLEAELNRWFTQQS
jgi:hypothetical protein